MHSEGGEASGETPVPDEKTARQTEKSPSATYYHYVIQEGTLSI